jgi:hypothetical protein
MNARLGARAAAVLLLCVLAATAGYAIGRSGGADLDAARAEGNGVGQERSRQAADRRGYAEGRRQGERAGYRATYRRAYRAAERKARAAAPPVASSQPTADTPSRAPPADDALVPCVYGPQALCTPAENEREGDAERLCGPGTEEGRREAARQGIQC